jgi:hypothetical protein
MAMKSQKPSEAAVKCREAVIAAIQPFNHELSGMEILAVLAYSVGQAIAMQDQRTVTHEMIWNLVGANIEAGNAMVINELAENCEGTA